MLLEVFIVTWNEEEFLSEIIDWYQERVPGCKVTIVDNESTDSTVEIAKSKGCEVLSFSSDDQMDEKTLINVRNNCWKGSQASYIIVCDADEFVDVNKEMLLDQIYKPWTIAKCLGYEMVGMKGDKIDDLRFGVISSGYSKPILFKNNHIITCGFEAGSHAAKPLGIVVWKEDFPNLYHTKHRSLENVLERSKLLAERRSDHSKRMGWNFHYGLPEEDHIRYRKMLLQNCVKVR